MKQDIILNIDAKGLEVGTNFAIFESITKLSDDSNTDQSETANEEKTTDSNSNTNATDNSTENIEKTFVIISLEDPAFEETISNIEDYETGTLLENGFEVSTSNEDLIVLSKLDGENLQNSITVINSNYQADNSWDTTNDAVDTKVDLSKEKNNSNGPKYYIKVSYTSNVVAIYTKDDSGEYNNLVKTMVCSTGTAASAGCVRLTVADAKWIYDNCASGCYVEFCTTLNVSKPSAAKNFFK